MTNQIALITGASRGLGAALAIALAGTHHIIAVGRTSGALEEIDDQISAQGGSATLAPLDVTDNDAMSHICRSIFDRWGTLDLWIHTAIHAAPLSPAAHMDAKDWQKSVETNVTATGNLIPLIAPLLELKSPGTAIFFDDPHAGERYFGAYGASKAAQISLVRSWQNEATTTGGRVKILTPNPMPTSTRARFFPGEDRTELSATQDEAARLLPEILN